MIMELKHSVLKTQASANYELLDSGDGEKLERYGEYVLRRPDPQALWKKSLSEDEWKKADGYFFRENGKTGWKKSVSMPNEWQISFDDLYFNIKPTAFKHTGVFPEQESNWKWIKEVVKKSGRPVKILNLFGYTGGATLAGLSAGAEVTHIDASKSTITWAKENAVLSGLKDMPVRWLVDDARKFVTREIKRGNKYDAIIMDPPSFGRGGKGEVWEIEGDMMKLIDDCAKILSDKPLFFLINGYASGYSAESYKNILSPTVEKYGGEMEFGELTIEESKSGRLLPCGIFARWNA